MAKVISLLPGFTTFLLTYRKQEALSPVRPLQKDVEKTPDITRVSNLYTSPEGSLGFRVDGPVLVRVFGSSRLRGLGSLGSQGFTVERLGVQGLGSSQGARDSTVLWFLVFRV